MMRWISNVWIANRCPVTAPGSPVVENAYKVKWMLAGNSSLAAARYDDACNRMFWETSSCTFEPWNSSIQPASVSRAIAMRRTIPTLMLASGSARSLELARRGQLERDQGSSIFARGLVDERG